MGACRAARKQSKPAPLRDRLRHSPGLNVTVGVLVRHGSNPLWVFVVPSLPECYRNPRILCRGTRSSSPLRSSGESCKPSVPASSAQGAEHTGVKASRHGSEQSPQDKIRSASANLVARGVRAAAPGAGLLRPAHSYPGRTSVQRARSRLIAW
jgi:hypothetical protein